MTSDYKEKLHHHNKSYTNYITWIILCILHTVRVILIPPCFICRTCFPFTPFFFFFLLPFTPFFASTRFPCIYYYYYFPLRSIIVMSSHHGEPRRVSFNVSDQYQIKDVVGEGAYGIVWYVSSHCISVFPWIQILTRHHQLCRSQTYSIKSSHQKDHSFRSNNVLLKNPSWNQAPASLFAWKCMSFDLYYFITI